MNLDQKYFKSQNETNNTAVEDRFIFSCYVAVGLFALSVFFEIIGSQDIVLYLLENGADIDMFNNHHNTPFFLATESLQKEICQVRNSDFTWLSISYDRFKETEIGKPYGSRTGLRIGRSGLSSGRVIVLLS